MTLRSALLAWLIGRLIGYAAVGVFVVHSSGCSTPLYQRGELAVQRLVPHPDYPGELVSQVCRERKGDDCVRWDLAHYDLKLSAERERLDAVKLECLIGGVRFAICLDQPGYCHREMRVTKRFPNVSWGIPVKRELVVTEYIPAVEGHQRLVDAAAECMAQDALARGFVGP